MVSSLHLHIVSFNIPYPPNYGGIIDVFWKIKALAEENIHIHLHCFHYGRSFPTELKQYCSSIDYYERKTGFYKQFSKFPYIVTSRCSDKLIKRLNQDSYPVLFEGIHTTCALQNKLLAPRPVFMRAHNIEHLYYKHLCRQERNIRDKLFFYIESKKLKNYESHFNKGHILGISPMEVKFFQDKGREVTYFPPFHPYQNINIISQKGNYALYHGNLSVRENIEAAIFLIKKVIGNSNIPFTIAGKDPPPQLIRMINKYNNIRLIPNPDDDTMRKLIQNAQVNILPTFQATGVKLKLLSSLFLGKYCLVNSMMVKGTGLESLCHIHDNPLSMKSKLDELFENSFNKFDIKKREKNLLTRFSNKHNAKTFINLLKQKSNIQDYEQY